MAFSRSSTTPSSANAESTHTLTLVFSTSLTSYKPGEKGGFQTDGDNCSKDCRPVVGHVRTSVDNGTQKMGDLVRVTKDVEIVLDTGNVISLKAGDPKPFWVHIVPKAADVEVDDLDW